MTTFALIPGAGGDPADWARLAPELRRRGHAAIAVDVPQHDESLGLGDLADRVVAQIQTSSEPGVDRPLVVVALSMGAYLGPLVCERVAVDLVVLLNPMIPAPGESANEWGDATGSEEARRAAGWDGFDLERDFFHDLPEDVAAQARSAPARDASDRSFAEPWPMSAWPDVPTAVIAGQDDRLFPIAFQRRVSRDRLGLRPYEMPGGHLLALSRSTELADRLEELAASLARAEK
jgi:pimeloyl-ACP methyl ester carboxylesterase